MVGDVNIFLHGTIPFRRQSVPASDSTDSSASAQSTSNSPEENDDGDESYAEVEIMIAGKTLLSVKLVSTENITFSEPSFRRKGLAMEALQLMLGYATGQPQAFSTVSVSDSATQSVVVGTESLPLKIPPEALLTRISDTNSPSIHLFEKLGFEITKRVEVFREVEMRFRRRFTT